MTKTFANVALHPTHLAPGAMIMLRALCERGALDHDHARELDSPQLAQVLVAAGLLDSRRVRPPLGITRTVYWVTERGQAMWLAGLRANSQKCRHCGCTDYNACMGADHQPCHWTEPGLCSAPDCQKKEQAAIAARD